MKHFIIILAFVASSNLVAGEEYINREAMGGMDKDYFNQEDVYTVIIKSPYDKKDDHMSSEIRIGPKERENLKKLTAEQSIQRAQDNVQNKLRIYKWDQMTLLEAAYAHGEAALLLRAHANILFQEVMNNHQDTQAKKVNSKL